MYMHIDEMPLLLFKIFVGQRDALRTKCDTERLWLKDNNNKQIIEHILDEVWALKNFESKIES